MQSLFCRPLMAIRILVIAILLAENFKTGISKPVSTDNLKTVVSGAEDATKNTGDFSDAKIIASNSERPHLNLEDGAAHPRTNPITELHNPTESGVGDAEKGPRLMESSASMAKENQPRFGDNWFAELIDNFKEAVGFKLQPFQNQFEAIEELKRVAAQSGNENSQGRILKRAFLTINQARPEELSEEAVGTWIQAFEDLMRPGSPNIKSLEIEASMQLGLLDILTKLDQNHAAHGTHGERLASARAQKNVVNFQQKIQDRLLAAKGGSGSQAYNNLFEKSKTIPWMTEILFPERGFNLNRSTRNHAEIIGVHPSAKTNYLSFFLLTLRKDLQIWFGKVYSQPELENDIFKGRLLISEMQTALLKSNGEYDSANKCAFLAILDMIINNPMLSESNIPQSVTDAYVNWKTYGKECLEDLLVPYEDRTEKLWGLHKQMVLNILRQNCST